jgi:SWI/SNF-related matrix-associated actin-dependent regulator of chromatin subfamily D
MDGFTLRKTGDAPARIRMILYLNHQPSQYKLHPDLGGLNTLQLLSLELTSSSGPALLERGLTNKCDQRFVELHQD